MPLGAQICNKSRTLIYREQVFRIHCSTSKFKTHINAMSRATSANISSEPVAIPVVQSMNIVALLRWSQPRVSIRDIEALA